MNCFPHRPAGRLPLVLARLTLACLAQPHAHVQAEALRLHPDNPHYFLWRGQPTLLITSGEHYGALLNLDFDYRKYVDTLAQAGLNNTRTFSGAYVETEGNFNIGGNTLNPAPHRFACPWLRSSSPGYADGGNRFDLTRWDESYFVRLREFVDYASQKGVVVEFNLFCPFYEESQWSVSPMNARNNINNLGEIPRTNVYTLDRHGGLLPVQENLVRRCVQELRDFDNVYYEICNEPYFGGVTLAWQYHIASVIQDTQKDHPHPKLISQNIANHSAKIDQPHPAISIFNFHYAAPPDTVALNYHLNKVIGDNETGFRGTQDTPYRTEAWDFIIAGGGLFNHLDYSFTVGHEQGTFPYPPTQPGGGGPSLRRQFRILRDFIHRFDFMRMRPEPGVVTGGIPPGGTARALVEPGRAWAIYLRQQSHSGPYSVRWTGYLLPRHSEEYTLYTTSNDGVRLWIGDHLLIDNWTDHGETEDTGRITLQAGQLYPVKVEYFYTSGQSVMRCAWSCAHQPKEPIPTQQWRQPDQKTQGLQGHYFHGKDLKKAWAQRADPEINFTWGATSPFPTALASGQTTLEVTLPQGRFQSDWIDTKSGQTAKSEQFNHSGGPRPMAAPAYQDDIALAIRVQP